MRVSPLSFSQRERRRCAGCTIEADLVPSRNSISARLSAPVLNTSPSYTANAPWPRRRSSMPSLWMTSSVPMAFFCGADGGGRWWPTRQAAASSGSPPAACPTMPTQRPCARQTRCLPCIEFLCFGFLSTQRDTSTRIGFFPTGTVASAAHWCAVIDAYFIAGFLADIKARALGVGPDAIRLCASRIRSSTRRLRVRR